MNFLFRKYDKYAIIEIQESNTTIDLGMLDQKEVSELKENVENFLEDLNWFLKETQ